MRHRKSRTRFGRQKSHRVATLRHLTRALLEHQRIKTTHIKAKEARKFAERLINIAKEDTVHTRRQAFAILQDRTLVSKLFKEIAPLFKERKGGFTRIIPFNFRKGDGASMVFLELTEKKIEEEPKPKRKAKARLEDRPQAEKKGMPKAAPEIKPQVKEAKTIEEAKKEKAREEERKIEKSKGFIKKIKGFWRRKTNM